jgi:hypothetical protein
MYMAHTEQVNDLMEERMINATGMINEVTLFTLITHRINYTGWMMK